METEVDTGYGGKCRKLKGNWITLNMPLTKAIHHWTSYSRHCNDQSGKWVHVKNNFVWICITIAGDVSLLFRGGTAHIHRFLKYFYFGIIFKTNTWDPKLKTKRSLMCLIWLTAVNNLNIDTILPLYVPLCLMRHQWRQTNRDYGIYMLQYIPVLFQKWKKLP